MSSIDKAKKQAKRLLDLAKTKSHNNEEVSLPLPNLNSAFEAISKMNGYPNWHDYRINLERTDMLSHKLNKRDARKKEKALLENKEYFLQDIPLTTVERRINQKDFSYVRKDHVPIVIGHNSNRLNKKNNGWLLNQYPFYIQGGAFGSRTEKLLSFYNEYLKNREGSIYFNITGDHSLYAKIFTIAQKIDRVQDFYVFLLYNKEGKARGTLAHSIDPINPMSQCPDYFENVFGKEIGAVIHNVVKTYNDDNKLFTVRSLPAFLMLKNIIGWNDKDLPAVQKYLKKIGYKNEINDDVLERHMSFCEQAYTVINQLIEFEHCFSHEPNIDLIRIFKERKILLVEMDCMANGIENITGPLKVLYQGILSIDKYLLKEGHSHCQNIIFNDCSLYLNDEREINNVGIIKESKNNYILADEALQSEKQGVSRFIEVSKTFAATKEFYHGTTNFIPLYIKLDAINNMPNVPPIFYANENIKDERYKNYHLNEIRPEEMYIFCNNNKVVNDKKIINNTLQYYIEKVTAIYHHEDVKGPIYLVMHNR